MIEKIKDILYDLSDIMVSLLIIAVIFFSVSWKISDVLQVDLAETLKSNTEATDDLPVTVIIPDINPESPDQTTQPENPDEGLENGENGDTPGDTDDGSGEGENATNGANPGESTNNAGETTTPPETSTPATLDTFIVADGATGYSIGKKLAEEGYVQDVDTFVNRLVAMKLDNKLRAGSFKISKSDDLDTIIKVLAGQGR